MEALLELLEMLMRLSTGLFGMELPGQQLTIVTSKDAPLYVKNVEV